MTGSNELFAPDPASRKVKPFELFFDLVFVFGFTQVTQFMANHPTWTGVGTGILILMALWWSWVGYSWLASTIDLEEGGVRFAMMAVMGGMLVAAMAVPEAFDNHALLFAVAYAFVRVMYLVIYAVAARGLEHDGLFQQVVKLAPSATLGAGLIMVAAFVDGDARWMLWSLALLIDYAGPLVVSPDGLVVSPGHFAERHGLIVIVALGEAIISIGAGAAGLALSGGLVVAAMLGYAAIVSVWWLYFDMQAVGAERRLAAAPHPQRNALARDGYSYMHLFIVGGLVLFSLGVKKAMGHPLDPMPEVGATVLFGGLAAVLFGQQALRARFIRSLSAPRMWALVSLVALAVWTPPWTALATLAAASAVMVGTVAYERLRYAEIRRRLRSGELAYYGADATEQR